jgi:glucan biosynthesis protein C
VLANLPSGLLLLTPLPVLAACEWLLAGRFPVTHALIDDWYTHATSLTFMLFGFVLATSADAWRSIERYRTVLVSAALALGLAYLGLRFGRIGQLSPEAQHYLRAGYGFAVVMAALALAQRYLNRPSPVLGPLNAAMLPCYVLHQTLIVCLGAWATAWGLGLGAEVGLIVVGTLVGCVLGYVIISRIALLRPLFGMPMRAGRPEVQWRTRR